MQFDNEIASPRGWKPYRSEWVVFNEDYQIAGSIDMVFRDDAGRLILVDWKRTKRMQTAPDRYTTSCTKWDDPPIQHESDTLFLTIKYGRRPHVQVDPGK